MFFDADDSGPDGRERELRRRSLFYEYRLLAVAAVVLILLTGLWLSYGAYAQTEYRTEETIDRSWSLTGSFDHQAPLQESTAAFPGESVLSEQPLYFTSIAPVAEGTVRTSYDGAEGEDVDISLVASVQYRSVDSADDTVYWEDSEPLGTEAGADLEPGESVTIDFTLNVDELTDSINEIVSDLGTNPGQTEVVVEIDRSLDGVIDGQSESVEDTIEIPIDYDRQTYAFEDPSGLEQTVTDTSQQQVPESPSTTAQFGGPLAILLGIALLGAIVLGSRRFPPLSSDEEEWLSFREARDDLEDVIVETSLPASESGTEVVPVVSLNALAGLGLELRKPVFHDRSDGRFVVQTADRTFWYEPPSLAPPASADQSSLAASSRATVQGAQPEETTRPAASEQDTSESEQMDGGSEAGLEAQSDPSTSQESTATEPGSGPLQGSAALPTFFDDEPVDTADESSPVVSEHLDEESPESDQRDTDLEMTEEELVSSIDLEDPAEVSDGLDAELAALARGEIDYVVWDDQ